VAKTYSVPSRNWFNSRISLSDADFALNPKTTSKNFTLNGSDTTLWEYELGKGSGQDVTIYVIDIGFVDNDYVRSRVSTIHAASDHMV
jgi:hypothetical protein